MSLTLQGGPFDGRVINIEPGSCAYINCPVVMPVYPDRYRPWVDGFVWEPSFMAHVYNGTTGIHIRGRMPANRMHWPRFDPFPRWTAFRRRIRRPGHRR
jgi:hypothetical protein